MVPYHFLKGCGVRFESLYIHRDECQIYGGGWIGGLISKK